MANQGTNNSLTTNWIRAQGGVDSYQVLLIHENVVIKNETVSSDTNKYHFHSLKPGGLYSVVVTTISGGISSRQAIAEGRTGKRIKENWVNERLNPRLCKITGRFLVLRSTGNQG